MPALRSGEMGVEVSRPGLPKSPLMRRLGFVGLMTVPTVARGLWVRDRDGAAGKPSGLAGDAGDGLTSHKARGSEEGRAPCGKVPRRGVSRHQDS